MELARVVLARLGPVERESLTSERTGWFALDLENDALYGVELGEGVNDLSNASEHRRRATTAPKLRTEIDDGRSVIDGQTE